MLLFDIKYTVHFKQMFMAKLILLNKNIRRHFPSMHNAAIFYFIKDNKDDS